MARQLSEQLEREVDADELLRNKPKAPMMNRISQPYIPPAEPATALPDLHAVSPDNPNAPLHVHDASFSAPDESHAAHAIPPAEVPSGFPSGVPDLHAVAPVDEAGTQAPLAPPHVDSRNPPNE